MMLGTLHHVGIGVQNGDMALKKFINQYQFRLRATRTTEFCSQWLVEKGKVRFLLTELQMDVPGLEDKCKTDDYTFLWDQKHKPCGKTAPADSVFNIALEVKDVKKCLSRVVNGGGTVVKCLSEVRSTEGHIQLAMVKSCVGNVVHTIINTRGFTGEFLPGFVTVPWQNIEANAIIKCQDNGMKATVPWQDNGMAISAPCQDNGINATVPCQDNDMAMTVPCQNNGLTVPDRNIGLEVTDSDEVQITHIDHITLACWSGRSSEVLQWYEECFGMKRFLINSDESESRGFVVQHGNLGVRLKAMEYWKCAETGLQWDSSEVESSKVKFVIAESLQLDTPDQVNVFLKEHGGEGIQHIGLHTPDIVHTVDILHRNGVEFTEPPFTYYTEVGKLKEMCEIGQSVEELKKHGILLDKESHEIDENPVRYLMQKFTKPLFSQKTFFLEVIQRVGATGFGTGNIIALWQSVQAYLEATAEQGDTNR